MTRRTQAALLLILLAVNGIAGAGGHGGDPPGAGNGVWNARAVGDDVWDAPNSEDVPQVSGSIGFGLTAASGSTDSTSTRLRLSARLDYVRWRHRFGASFYRSEEGNDTTADRRSGFAQSDWRMTQRSYLFVNVNGERDRFGAFARRYSGTLGVGRRFLDTAAMDLDLELGAGRRYVRAQDSGESGSEGIGRFHGVYRWHFGVDSEFLQDVAVESGSDTTYTESETAVRSGLTENLRWTVSYVIQHNSDVPEDRERTDSLTAITLDYGF